MISLVINCVCVLHYIYYDRLVMFYVANVHIRAFLFKSCSIHASIIVLDTDENSII